MLQYFPQMSQMSQMSYESRHEHVEPATELDIRFGRCRLTVNLVPLIHWFAEKCNQLIQFDSIDAMALGVWGVWRVQVPKSGHSEASCTRSTRPQISPYTSESSECHVQYHGHLGRKQCTSMHFLYLLDFLHCCLHYHLQMHQRNASA